MVGGLGLGGSLISYEAAMVPGGANLVSKVLANDDGRYRLEAVLESAKRDVSDLWGEQPTPGRGTQRRFA